MKACAWRKPARRKAGVKIRALVASDDQFDFGAARWDLIVMTYIRSLSARDAERIRRALAPGGIFVYENGSDRHNQLLKLFLDFSHPALRRRGRLPGLESRRKNPPGALGGGEATGVTSHHDHIPILRRAAALRRRRPCGQTSIVLHAARLLDIEIRQNAEARRGAGHRRAHRRGGRAPSRIRQARRLSTWATARCCRA